MEGTHEQGLAYTEKTKERREDRGRGQEKFKSSEIAGIRLK